MCKRIEGIKTCRLCGVQIHYRGNCTILYEDMVSAGGIVSLLEGHISKRDGINFRFEYGARAKELHLAYELIYRAKKYLSRQIDIGISAPDFCLEIVMEVLSDSFWSRVTKSIAMFMKHIGEFAVSVFLKLKNDIEGKVRDKQLSSFVDFLEVPDGGGDCYPVATIS